MGATVTIPTLSVGNVGHHNGVVIADSPAAYAAGVLAPLSTYESTFGVRQLDGYKYPSPALGVTDITSGGLDGTAAHLTTAGLALLPRLKGPLHTGQQVTRLALRLPGRCNMATPRRPSPRWGRSAAAGRDGDG